MATEEDFSDLHVEAEELTELVAETRVREIVREELARLKINEFDAQKPVVKSDAAVYSETTWPQSKL